MSVVGPSIPEYDYFPSAPPSLIGVLTSGLNVVVEVWRDGDVVPVTAAASGCTEIGNTGKYVFSTAHLPPLTHTREQYHYRMSDGGTNTDEGDFILRVVQLTNVMPSLTDNSSYVMDPRP
jgi:hypothetical protein